MGTVADRLWAWRHAYRLTQEEAAAVMAVSLSTYSRWERGVSAPNGAQWRAIQDVLYGDAVPGHLGKLLGLDARR